MNDNARHAQPEVTLLVEITPGTPSHFFTGLARDLSRAGLFVATYRDLPVGSHVSLELELPGGKVRARGKVAWLRALAAEEGPGVGVRLEPLDAEARAEVERFCRRRPPLYYEDDLDEALPETG